MGIRNRMATSTGRGIVVVVLALAGCSRAESGEGSTEHSTAVPSASSQRSVTDEIESIKRVYTQFWAFLAGADKIPVSSLRQEAATYTVEPQLSKVLDHASELRSRSLTTYGAVVVHVRNVTVTGDQATLVDCQDARNSGLMNTTTRKKINRGVAGDHYEVSLVRGTDGRWRIKKAVNLSTGC